MTNENNAIVTSRLTNSTLSDLIATGETIATAGLNLEKLIWQIRAEAYGQFDDAVAKYLEDEKKIQGSGSVKEVLDAGNCVTELDKLWQQGLALRNRAIHFAGNQLGDTPTTRSRWPALKRVFDARREEFLEQEDVLILR